MLIVPIIVLSGLVLGWCANIVFRPRYLHGVVINVLVGLAGAVIAGQLFAPVFQRPPMLSGYFSAGTVAIAIAGSLLLLLLVEVVRRAGTR